MISMNYLTSPAPNGQPITFCYSGVGIDLTAKENGYREFAANGQKYVVLDTTLLRAMIADEKLIKKYQKILPELGVEFCDAHSFYNELDDMCCPDEAIRPRMLERHKIAMDISAAFGVDTITIHMGRFTDHSISPRTHIDYAMKSLEELLPVAEKLGMVICIENVWYQTSAASTLLEAIERFKTPALGVCFDAGHANIMSGRYRAPENRMWATYPGREPDWNDHVLDDLFPHIVNCHLHDNNGVLDMHQIPGDGNVDWKSMMPKLKMAPRLRVFQCEAATATGVGPNNFTIRKAVDRMYKLIATDSPL